MSMDSTEAHELYTKRHVWTTQDEIILSGFVFSRFLLKGRVSAPVNVAKKFGLDRLSLLCEDCAKIHLVLSKVFGRAYVELKPWIVWGRFKIMRRKNRLQDCTFFRRIYLEWKIRFNGEKLLEKCPEIFDDGVFMISNAHLEALVKNVLNDKINNVPFLIRRPSERILSLMDPHRSTEWRYEENVLLAGLIAERFTTLGSMNPMVEAGHKVSAVTDVWNVTKIQFDFAICALKLITGPTENGYSFECAARSSTSLLRRYKLLRSSCSKSQIDEQGHGSKPDKFLFELVADFRYINQNRILTGGAAPTLDISAERHRIKTFLALRKSHCHLLDDK